MKVYLRVFGGLSRVFGDARVAIDLPQGAVLRDVMVEVDQRWGAKLGSDLWDREAKVFRGPAVLVSNNQDLIQANTPLADDQVIMVVMPIAGG